MDGEICVRQAYDAILHGDFESAIGWFARAIELDPGNASYYYKGSITCARSGRYALALEYAAKAVELAPDDEAYRMNSHSIRAKSLVAEATSLLSAGPGHADRCIALLAEAARLDPFSTEAWQLLNRIRDERRQLYKL